MKKFVKSIFGKTEIIAVFISKKSALGIVGILLWALSLTGIEDYEIDYNCGGW